MNQTITSVSHTDFSWTVYPGILIPGQEHLVIQTHNFHHIIPCQLACWPVSLLSWPSTIIRLLLQSLILQMNELKLHRLTEAADQNKDYKH